MANASISDKIVEFIAFDMGAQAMVKPQMNILYRFVLKMDQVLIIKLKSHLINLCKINDIPYKVDIYPYYSSDASAAQKQVQTFVMVYLVLV